MKRVVTLLLAILFCTEALAQSNALPKIAVYATGDLNESEKHALAISVR